MSKFGELTTLLDKLELVDLTFTMESGMPTWPTHPKFYHDLVESYTLGDEACHFQLVMGEHCGTHLDAPLHFVPSGPQHYGVDQIPLHKFYGRAAVIEAGNIGANGVLTLRDIQKWEEEYEQIVSGDIVLIHFGWDQYWAKKPSNGKFLKDWPGLAKDAADYLAEKKVKAVGTDALALDVFNSSDCPAHHTLLERGILIIENLNNLGQLSPISFFMGFPLKIAGGSGSPIRAIAFKA